MIKLLFIFFLTGCYTIRAQDTLLTNIFLDSIGNEVALILDDKKRPTSYYSAVFTPVCVDGSCYPININLYWDLAGNYVKYGLDEDEILTKIEHLPFTEFDYGLLHRMIERSPSALADFTIYELTLPKSLMDVDGTTGATRPELAGSFVPDALFTTYTLWHLVRKPGQQLLSYTHSNYFNEEWTDYLLNNPELGCQEALIAVLLEGKQGDVQIETLFNLIDQLQAGFPFELLHQIPPNYFTTAYAQEKVRTSYSTTRHDELKLTILNLWQAGDFSGQDLKVLTQQLGNCPSCFSQELKLIDNFSAWPEEQFYLYYSKIQEQNNMMRKEKMRKILNKRADSFPKKFVKLLKNS